MEQILILERRYVSYHLPRRTLIGLSDWLFGNVVFYLYLYRYMYREDCNMYRTYYFKINTVYIYKFTVFSEVLFSGFVVYTKHNNLDWEEPTIMVKNIDTDDKLSRKDHFIGIRKGLKFRSKKLERSFKKKGHTEDWALGSHPCDNGHLTH